MWHLPRDLQAQFDDPSILPVFVPWCLVDQIFDALLLDGVDVRLAAFEQCLELRACRLGVAVKDVRPDQLRVVFLLRGSVVHLEQDAVLIAHLDLAGEFLSPFHGFSCITLCYLED